jgi:hypothetical protein
MKNIRLNDYFVTHILSFACEVASHRWILRSPGLLDSDQGFTIFTPSP